MLEVLCDEAHLGAHTRCEVARQRQLSRPAATLPSAAYGLVGDIKWQKLDLTFDRSAGSIDVSKSPLSELPSEVSFNQIPTALGFICWL